MLLSMLLSRNIIKFEYTSGSPLRVANLTFVTSQFQLGAILRQFDLLAFIIISTPSSSLSHIYRRDHPSSNCSQSIANRKNPRQQSGFASVHYSRVAEVLNSACTSKYRSQVCPCQELYGKRAIAGRPESDTSDC